MSPRLGFERKWKIWVKKWKPMFQKFLQGPGPEISPRGSWRVTRISGGETLKISKWVFTMYSLDREISGTIFSFQIRWAETKIFGFEDFGLEVERSQPVGPKIWKWVFSHLFHFPHRTHRNWQNWIWMSITHFINFQRSATC